MDTQKDAQPHMIDRAMDYATLTDEQLAEACKSRDEQAFQALMNRYLRQIFNFARQYAHAAEDADDITQDTFFKVWKYIGRYTTGRQFRPWLYTIARNTALDHVKKKRAATFSDLDNDDSDLQFADTLEDPEPLPAEIFENKELVGKLTEAMEELRPDYRAILLLHYREEMSFEEISSVVGKPMNTVKSWHRRSVLKLRELLTHHI